MAVPKKKTSRSITRRRKKNWYKIMQRKLSNFIERAKRNARGAAMVAERKDAQTTKNVTKIEA